MKSHPEEDYGAESEVPRDIEVGVEDLDPKILRAARMGAEAALNRIPLPTHDYSRHGNGEKVVLKWLLWIAGGALLLALGGSWSMYGALSHVSQQVTDYHEQDAQNSERNHEDIQRINEYLEKRYAQ